MKITLASGSPRRRQLLKDAGLSFNVLIPGIKEHIPRGVHINKVAEYLAVEKSISLPSPMKNEVYITADTVVILHKKILGKPKNKQDAKKMLKALSGKCHTVITGVCLRSVTKMKSFSETSRVYFRHVSENEIDYYVSRYKPYDKAGAYGIQDWFGLRFIKRIEGCFYNVMGLPVSRLIAELCRM